MVTANNTKDTIVAISAKLMHLKGFNNTGIQEILQKADVPKGSFYYYFKSKDDLGLQVIEYYTNAITSIFQQYLNDTSFSPLQRLENLIMFYARHFKKMNYTLGCPIGNFSLEMSDLSEHFRVKLNHSIQKLIRLIDSCLQQAKDSGEISDDVDTTQAAEFIFQGFEGALLRMKVVKSDRPIIVFKNSIMKYLKET
ncbi:MAG: TetR/AcrR family transcriptional regulator [Spirochaetes bacterium]|nr:TetR/AcrR family transcriptional regulator [Spirochaetota bacterium]